MAVSGERLPVVAAMGELGRLRQILEEMERVVVAFSGGADSAFLAWVANDTLGPERAIAATALSASLPGDEEAECRALARGVGAHLAAGADRRAGAGRLPGQRRRPLLPLQIRADGPARAGRSRAGRHRRARRQPRRPRRPPARSAGGGRARARFPLVEAGFTKADVRAASQRLGLRTWDKPAAACLASRLPYGTPVSVALLSQVERAEQALRRLGFAELRVRHYGDTARLELPVSDLASVLTRRDAVVRAVRGAGYRYVTLDLEGLRSGNLNQALADAGRPGA